MSLLSFFAGIITAIVASFAFVIVLMRRMRQHEIDEFIHEAQHSPFYGGYLARFDEGGPIDVGEPVTLAPDGTIVACGPTSFAIGTYQGHGVVLVRQEMIEVEA